MKLIAGLITILAGLGIAGYGLANGNFIVTGAGIIVIITGFKVLTSWLFTFKLNNYGRLSMY